MRRGLVCLLLLAGGCQKLFGLRSIDGPATDASGVDTAHDTGTDGTVTSCANPQMRTGTGLGLVSAIDEIAIPEDQSFAIVNAGGQIYVFDPLVGGAAQTIAGIAGTGWSHPALPPDGTQLLLANADTYVWRSVRTGGTSSWTAPTHAVGIATTVHPGAMGRAADGTLRVVVTEGPVFREYAYDGQTWTMAPQTMSATELTGDSTLAISDPALTADATTLVFIAMSTTGPSVWHVRRNDTSLSTKFMLTTSSSAGPLVTGSSLATPYLADDCTLYVVSSKQLVRFAP